VALAACWTSGGLNVAAEPRESGVDSETAARQEVLQSKEWREMKESLGEWLSVQTIYGPEQVKQLKANFNGQIAQMSASQLRDFNEQMNEKLKILLGAEAREARAWMRQYLSVASEAKIKQMRKNLPDIATATPEQLQEALKTFEQRRGTTKQTQAAFQQGQQALVKATKEELERQRDENERALERAYLEPSSVSGYYGGYYGGYPGYGGYRVVPYRGFRW
jgi:paraquat-inducible protein B